MSKIVKDGPWATQGFRGQSLRAVRLTDDDAYVGFRGRGARAGHGYKISNSTKSADRYQGRKGAQTSKRGRVAE